jgi:hypothetical protein
MKDDNDENKELNDVYAKIRNAILENNKVKYFFT